MKICIIWRRRGIRLQDENLKAVGVKRLWEVGIRGTDARGLK